MAAPSTPTVTRTARGSLGGHTLLVTDVNLGNNYNTGGIAISANLVQLGAITDVIATPAGGYVPEWDQTNLKMKLRWSGTATNTVLAEVATDTDVSAAAATFRCIFFGRP